MIYNLYKGTYYRYVKYMEKIIRLFKKICLYWTINDIDITYFDVWPYTKLFFVRYLEYRVGTVHTGNSII